jgi:tRNA uridine 5-carboxymethylaminomethyl modification enzyme
MKYGHDLGLLPESAWDGYKERRKRVEDAITFLKKNKLIGKLKKPDVRLGNMLEYGKFAGALSPEEIRHVESEVKYEGYIKKQEREIAKGMRSDSMRIPADMDYGAVPGLTRELVEKLGRSSPTTMGDARRVTGMTPAALHNVGLHLEILRKKGLRKPPVSRETGPDDE